MRAVQRVRARTTQMPALGKLKPFDTVLDIAESLQLKHGEFMEQVSEVEAFIGLDAINTLFHPVDVKGSDN